MWYHNGQEITSIAQMPEGVFGFIYKITNTLNSKGYIGRKNIYSVTNKPLTKKELQQQQDAKKPGKKPTKKQVTKESDWLKYYGSEPNLKEDIKQYGKDKFKREIIEYTFSPKETTYKELKHQILNGVLESDDWYNSNLLGKFFRKDLKVSS